MSILSLLSISSVSPIHVFLFLFNPPLDGFQQDGVKKTESTCHWSSLSRRKTVGDASGLFSTGSRLGELSKFKYIP